MSNAPYTTQQAAAQIVALINSRATSPRQDEIEAILAKLSGGEIVEHEPATLEQAAMMTFDANPVSFEDTIGDYMPAVRTAFLGLLQRDHEGAETFIRELRDGCEDWQEIIMALGDDIETAQDRFDVLSELMEAAHARLLIACAREELARNPGKDGPITDPA